MTTETTGRRGPARVDERFARPLFILTIVTGSFLLFLTQPMIARMALPRIGGAPSVWNSAMLVYQALLLAGYAYAHWVSKIRPRKQVGVHVVLLGLAALWLPIGLSSAIPPVERCDLISAYHRRLTSDDETTRLAAARASCPPSASPTTSTASSSARRCSTLRA